MKNEMTQKRVDDVVHFIGSLLLLAAVACSVMLPILTIAKWELRKRNNPYPHVKYGDRVVVTRGFYEGQEGVADDHYQNADGTFDIWVHFEEPPDVAKIPEDDLHRTEDSGRN